LWLFAASLAWADLTVRVVDPSGASVPDATVVLRLSSGEAVADGVTAASGAVRFSEMAERVEIAASGFASEAVPIDGRSQVVVILEIEQSESEVDVLAAAPALAPVASDALPREAVAATDLVESLASSPHVRLVRRGGTNFEPVVQGLREAQVVMVVDGTRTFAAGPARMDSDLSHVDPGSVDSVEVVTGPYALSEGAGAMAAIVVNSDQIPRKDAWRLGGRASLGWRNNGAGRVAQTRVHAGDSDFGFRLHASGSLQDDYNAGTAGARPDVLVPADASAHQFGGRFRFNLTDTQELSVGGFYDEETGIDYPGRLLTAEHFLLRSWSARYRLAGLEGPLRALTLNAYSNGKGHRMSNRGKPTRMDMPGRTPPFGLDISLPAESHTLGASGRIELAASGNWRVYAGFDHFTLEQDAQRFIYRSSDRKLLFSDAVWAGTSLRNTGLYVQGARDFSRGGVFAAVRVDRERSDAGHPSEFFLANAGSQLDVGRTSPSFSFAGRYDLTGGLTLAGGVGRVRRPATSLERYSDRFPSTRFQVAAEFMGDPLIRPEASLQTDLGLQWKVGAFRFDAGGFVRSLSDYITVAADPSLPKRLPLSPPVVFRYVNGASALFRGWNLGARWITDRLQVKLQASKILADDHELSEPVLGIPPLEFDASLRYVAPKHRWWAEFGTRNVWDQQRVSAARLETQSPGFTLHRFRLGVDLWQGASWYASATNVGDKFYSEHLNSLNPFTRERVPEMGRALTTGLTMSW
jgi:iron complex outermembrane receptor protein